ncbi:hypothetical protein EGW08_002893 [Elysia chlorotica]|uniref:G-protein coupled receptors family 1 profile domain-containing protein n=1 Tax=Elysia chlorotica TaxID=188477 RepID=A0A433U6C1_ELYCH|nr:hypothetical protein EGW08_002893 [Elysia chlorotica]
MDNYDTLQNFTLYNTTSIESVEDINAIFAKLPFRTAYFIGRCIIPPLYFPLLVFGITSNIVNIIVYAKTGSRDNVTVSFMALSLSDLLFLLLVSPYITIDTLEHPVQYRLGKTNKWLFDYNILRFPFYWYGFTFYEVSILITVYISVVRCACVAIPFTVRNMFTARRASITFAAFFVSNFALRFPMFMSKRMVRQFDPVFNATMLVYIEVKDGGIADKINDIAPLTLYSLARRFDPRFDDDLEGSMSRIIPRNLGDIKQAEGFPFSEQREARAGSTVQRRASTWR